MDLNSALDILYLKKTNLTLKQIKKSYYKLALQYHPDKNKSIDANQKFKFINNIKIIIKNRIDETKNIIIIEPDIDNLLNNEIYKLNYNNETYYIPLWHNEIEYTDQDNNLLIVKVTPKLQKHIFIEDDNSIHVNITEKVNNLINHKIYKVIIGKKTLELDITHLYIKNFQTICLKNKGCSKINYKDYYNIDEITDIFIHLTLY
jgi:DnaJ-class molecular chaperone